VLPLSWRTRIERVTPGLSFVDAQLRGPYRAWFHEHEFVREGSGTLMIDRVWYAPPFGWLGEIAQVLLVARNLRRIFRFRGQRARLRFGAPQDHA
jgi:ligand-binding SRPBCC domain-containing protein